MGVKEPSRSQGPNRPPRHDQNLQCRDSRDTAPFQFGQMPTSSEKSKRDGSSQGNTHNQGSRFAIFNHMEEDNQDQPIDQHLVLPSILQLRKNERPVTGRKKLLVRPK